MFASYEYQLSKDEYLRGLQAVYRSIAALDSRPALRSLEQIGFLVLVLVVVSLLIPDSSNAVLLTLVLTVAGGCVLQARLARRWRELTFGPDQANVALKFDDQGIVIERPDARSRYGWDALRRIHDMPEAIILETADWRAFTLPNRLWAEFEERTEFIVKVRHRATHLLADLPTTGPMSWSAFIELLGAAAFALTLMIELEQQLAGIGDCSCTFRHSLIGRLLPIAPYVAYCAAFAIVWVGLKWLDRRRPKMAVSLALLFIAVFVASQAIPPALQIYRSVSSPAT